MNALRLLFWCYIYPTAIIIVIKRCGAVADAVAPAQFRFKFFASVGKICVFNARLVRKLLRHQMDSSGKK